VNILEISVAETEISRQTLHMIERQRDLSILKRMLRQHPVVGIVGARQVGKTTLAHMLAESREQQIYWFDLENPGLS
jgi:predicted AAA+ superfamily ATPase